MNKKEKLRVTRIKLIILLATITMTTSCATNKRHKKIALKLVKNNNVILKEIKKERKEKIIVSHLKKSKDTIEAEKRLLTAINAVIQSNNSLTKEFLKEDKKEVKVERIKSGNYHSR